MPSKPNEAETPATTEVTVIGGYLGAGKTTLVNHILRTADATVAVLVNDFGDINIDEELIESEDGDTISLANGCICCSLVDGFAAALATISELDPIPQRLVIEASGVADPGSVAAYGHGPGLTLDAVVVVVDGETVKAKSIDKYVGDTVLGQLRSADIIVLNKLDLIDDQRADEVRSWLQEQSPDAVVHGATNSEVDAALLFGSIGGRRSKSSNGTATDTNPAESVFQSWSWESSTALERASVERLMAELPETVVRAKGVLALTEAPSIYTVLQRVGKRWSLRPGGPLPEGGRSQLVFIGMTNAINHDWLEAELG